MRAKDRATASIGHAVRDRCASTIAATVSMAILNPQCPAIISPTSKGVVRHAQELSAMGWRHHNTVTGTVGSLGRIVVALRQRIGQAGRVLRSRGRRNETKSSHDLKQ